MLATIHHYLFMGVTTLFLFQSAILFIRSKNNKVRKTMAIVELLWGLEYLTALTLILTIIPEGEFVLLREKVLIIGNYFIIFTHFFPIQVLLPGWLNWKKITLLLLPVTLLTIIFYGGTYLLGETPESLTSYAVIKNSIGHFNVWFRLVFLFSNITYMLVILAWLYKYEKRYIRWKNENFSDQEYVDISWMRSYDYIIIGIFVFYAGILFIGGRLPIIFHSSFAIFCFSYLFYKALFYENPYPEDFFTAESHVVNAENSEIYHGDLPTESVPMNDYVFEKKIPSYTETIKQWMEEEKPYLFNDFKLTDVSHLLPLNRSYLSRVFNEGFGQNFSEVVRAYRINYSKEILKNNPTIPMYQVASLSGFRSDSTFIKAFKQVTNMTPSQYKGKTEEE